MKILFAGPDPDLVMRADSGADRKEGLHLSDITKRMMFEKDKKYDPEKPLDMMVIESGYTWETVLEGALSARNDRPGFRPDQMQEDGIWMSADWVNPDAKDIQHEEWKATKKKCSRDSYGKDAFHEKNWYWLVQAKAYLRALLKRGIARSLRTRFRVWHINGDYSYEAKTSDFKLLNDYWTYDVEFDKRELDENWDRLLSQGRKYGLLKTQPKEEPCHEEPTPPRSPLKRKPPSSRALPPSRKGARVVTFPSSRTSRSRSSD